MARSAYDSWDTARAAVTRGGLIDDPFGEPLVHAVGVDFFTRLASGERALVQRLRAQGLDVDLIDLTYPGGGNEAAEYLAAQGRQTVGMSLAALFAATGLPHLRRDDAADASVSIAYVNATRS